VLQFIKVVNHRVDRDHDGNDDDHNLMIVG